MAIFWNIVKRKDYSLRTCPLNLVAFIFSFFLFNSAANAQGDLLIFPKRIVFDEGKRVKQLILSNIGKDTAIYNVSFLQYRMNENGGFKAITTPDVGQYFATPYLRVFPRKVTLAPNESQIVKVQLTKSTKLKEGEYRSHLYFRAKKKQQSTWKEGEGRRFNIHICEIRSCFWNFYCNYY
jgi:P pilus assembly chaperone PapD